MAILAAFLVSRVLYYLAGIRFDSSPIASAWQYIDPVLMRTRLLESMFYLHMQPPGFNLAIGSVIAFLLLRLMRLFRIPDWIGAPLTIVFIVNPGCVLYENSAVYEYPIL